jgi:hypothetical protein
LANLRCLLTQIELVYAQSIHPKVAGLLRAPVALNERKEIFCDRVCDVIYLDTSWKYCRTPGVGQSRESDALLLFVQYSA